MVHKSLKNMTDRFFPFNRDRQFSKIPVYFLHKLKILVYFLTGVLNFIFGKIFGKFRKTFRRSKPLFSFGPVLTIESQTMLKYWESQKAKKIWQTHGLTFKSIYKTKDVSIFSKIEIDIVCNWDRWLSIKCP